MPEIAIHQSTFERLQRHAKPFVDTPDAVITRALDALEQQGTLPPLDATRPANEERHLDPRALPNLTHSKVLEASIDGEPMARPKWNRVLVEVLRRAMSRAGSFSRLQHACPANMVQGRKEDEGYSYLSEIDLSIQGQSANKACHAIVTTSQEFGIALDIGVMWRANDAAAYPGERGRITLGGPRVREETVGRAKSQPNQSR